MKETIRYTPPNSIVFVSDIEGGLVPPSDNWKAEELIFASDSCVCVVCYPEVDGETEISLKRAEDVHPDPEFDLVFDGVVTTPSKEIMVSNVEIEPLLQAAVDNLQTRIRVWMDHDRWPQKVVIGWG
ncbi:MAG: hypothetical protein AB7P20_06355 [Rhizobiaceae bacterium]